MTSAVVVAGPGVVPDGVDAVRRFAAATGVGVLNTFGVKGLFRWDDPAHLGTIGLQAGDVELAGVLDADVVLAVGLDDRELGAGALGPRVEVVAPAALDAWAARVEPAPRGRLYDELRAALLPLYASDAVPLTPAAAVHDLRESLPDVGLVCADPGPVGLWVARALPTLELGSVHVPAAGLAEQRAVDAAREGRPVVYATHRSDVEAIDGVVVEVWSGAGVVASRAERLQRLSDALAGRRSARFETPVDLSLTSVLVDVAGPVTAWPDVNWV